MVDQHRVVFLFCLSISCVAHSVGTHPETCDRIWVAVVRSLDRGYDQPIRLVGANRCMGGPTFRRDCGNAGSFPRVIRTMAALLLALRAYGRVYSRRVHSSALYQ